MKRMAACRHLASRFSACLAAVTLVGLASPAVACPACFGDPDSSLTQGAASGVLFMALLTYAMLVGFGGFAVLWFMRARRLRGGAAAKAATEADSGRMPR